MPDLKHALCEKVAVTLLLMVMSMGGVVGKARQPGRKLPIVIAASVPLYPPPARLLGIEGAVLLRVFTDGERVSSVSAISGPYSLQKLAKDNVQTWQFEKHSPTSFEVTYRFKLLDCRECSDNSVVTLRLPTEVEIKAPMVIFEDPVTHRSKDAVAH